MAMYRLAACLLALTAAAHADRGAIGTPPRPGMPTLQLPSKAPAKRKPASDKYRPKALSLFVDAIVFDKAGNLEQAARAYEAAAKDQEQANIFFNLGDLQRRREKYDDAIEAYEKYLALAPTAPDRKEVQRAIDELRSTPFVAVIDGHAPDAIVLVDGVLIGPSPVVIQLSPGLHQIDRIAATEHRGTTVDAKPGKQDHVELNPIRDEPQTGNVVMVGSPAIGSSGNWDDPVTGQEYQLNHRFELPPGRHETVLWKRGRACQNIVFDVPRTKDILFVYLDAKPPEQPGGCLPIKVRTQVLKVVGR